MDEFDDVEGEIVVTSFIPVTEDQLAQILKEFNGE